MKEALEFYQQQLVELVDENSQPCDTKRTIPSWLASLHYKGSELFNRLGFPNRQQEAWRYTALDHFLKHRFLKQSLLITDTVNNDNQDFANIEDTQRADTLFAKIPHLRIHQQLAPKSTCTVKYYRAGKADLPSGLIFMPLNTALASHETYVKPYLDQIIRHQHGFHALNTASLDLGSFVYVPAGMKVTIPLILSYCGEASQMFPLRNLIVLEPGSEAIVVEDYHEGESQETAFTNTITEVMLAQDSNFTHYKIQRESKATYHIGHVAVRQLQGSHFQSHLLNLGGKLARSEYYLQLAESEAHCSLNGIYLPSRGQHMDQQSLIRHEVPHCSSEQDYKGILMGGSRAVFDGKIRVEKYARQTEAKQQNKNLLLALDAEIDTQPQLEIFADDVICTHGATVGQLDEEALFYMMARGIDKDEARRYLVQGFIEANLRSMTHPELAQCLGNLIYQRLSEALLKE